MITGIDRTPVDAIVLALLLALLTVRHSPGESLFLEMLKAGGIIGKFAIEIIDRVP